MSLWCDCADVSAPSGTVGFLIRVEREGGRPRYLLSDRPQYTNQSHEPRLRGWCGTTDNVARYADGLARVSAVAPNGRARLERVRATQEALETLGYPELVSEDGR